jgi:phosphoribosylamine--glycine ligase
MLCIGPKEQGDFMRVLVVGSGGREHALCWALSASPLIRELWCAPGNPGTAEVAQNVEIDVLAIPELVAFAREHAIDLVVPGPEAPLVAGLADALAAAGIRCCGPSAAAARLEGSKSFAREVAAAAGIPIPRWECFTNAADARAFLHRRGAPIVVKADGLAAGKGVVVAETEAEAEAAINAFMEEGSLGEAGRTVLLEERLEGEEISLFALCDGEHAVFLGAAQDHKRAGEGDTGPNTGGMGAYSPPARFSSALADLAMGSIVRPALAEMVRRGAPFRGVLFAGLILTEEGPKLLEFNVRFGDPECQALMLRLHSDLLPGLLAACDQELGAFDLRLRNTASIAVVMAARGYPGAPVRGGVIEGLAEAAKVPGVQIFHAGTAWREGKLIANGGRVLNVCAEAPNLHAAREAAYRALRMIRWEDGFYRADIGWRALAAEA